MSRNSGRRSTEEISAILSDLKSSGMSQRAIAESRGISLSTLSYWKVTVRPPKAVGRLRST